MSLSNNNNNNDNNDIIICRFNKSLTITYSKKESNIINGKRVEYEITTFQKIIESHFKNRPNDKIHLNHKNSFNYVENQYVQILCKIQNAIKEGKDSILFTCDVQHEILCGVCKQEWFVPQYRWINMCGECNDCFFD
jgi:hypothetical protein